MADIPEFPEEFIENYLNDGNFQRQLYWSQIYATHRMCSQMNPGDRPSLEDVRACIGKKEKKTANYPVGSKPGHGVRNL